jgi:hypothetical protein
MNFQVNMQNVVRGARALFPPKAAILREYYELVGCKKPRLKIFPPKLLGLSKRDGFPSREGYYFYFLITKKYQNNYI